MASIRTAPTVNVTSPGIGITPAIVRRFSWTRGAQAAECVLDLPAEIPGRDTWSDGLELNVYVESYPVFRGVTVATSRSVGGQNQQVRISARDMRHVLQGRNVGEWDIGPLASYSGLEGGWPGMGYELLFNKDNKPNRSPYPASTSVSFYSWNISVPATYQNYDIYKFSYGEDAEYWTFKQILVFLFYWNILPGVLKLPDATSGQSLSGTIYDDTAPEVDARTGTQAHVIDRITSQLGGSWTLAYTGAPGSGATHAYYNPLHEDIGAQTTITIQVDTPSSTSAVNKRTASRIDLTENTGHVYDRVQVLSESRIVETTYSNLGPDPLLNRRTSNIPDDEICWFVTNPQNYDPWGLAPNLDSDAAPKPWVRYLATRRKNDGTYAAASDNKDNKDRISCKEALWITDEANASPPTWHRVKSGVDIDLDKARLRVKKEITVYGDTKDKTAKLALKDASKVGINITVGTRVEMPDYAHTLPSDEYLNYSRMRSVTRHDLQPLYRYDPFLPDPSSDNPADYIVPTSGWEVYEDVRPQLTKYKDRLYNATSQKEQRARIRLPQFPGIQLGWKLAFSPASYGLPDLRVREVQYDPVNYDTIVTATSNMDMATV